MNILDGIKNVLMFVNEHWTEVMIVVGLLIAAYRKIAVYVRKSDDEKIQIAKEQLREIMLKFVTDAEVDYNEWKKAGAVKRAQVVKAIFEQYPVLSHVTDQETLMKEIDKLIDEALEEMRSIFEKNVGVSE